MDSNQDSLPDNHIGGGSPEARWIAWGIWSGISLAMVLVAVFMGGIDTVLLLGWAVGISIAAMLMVFRRAK